MTRKQFMVELAKYPGVTLDLLMEDNDTLQIDSPKGKIFSAVGGHTMVEVYANNGGQSWKSEAYNDLIEWLKYGLEDCPDGNECEICGEEQ